MNLDLSVAASQYGLYFAPDPSSQRACTIGGNVAENSGGPHCLRYGVTTNHVLSLEVALEDASVVWLGDPYRSRPGYDLVGAFVGSEGMMGVVTKAVVGLLPAPQSGEDNACRVQRYRAGQHGCVRGDSQRADTNCNGNDG